MAKWHGFYVDRGKTINMKNRFILIAALFALYLTACVKNPVDESGILNVRLTDAPIDLDSVFVDIKEVNVKTGRDELDSSSTGGWISLNTNAGVYNLLGLQNGVDTLLATGPVPVGYIKEIRLVLGSNNRVVDTFGISHPLTIPSGGESGLKIKINKKQQATLQTILIDFDAALSIKKENDGYKLRPVIKIK